MMYRTLNLHYQNNLTPRIRLRLEPGHYYGLGKGLAGTWFRVPPHENRVRIGLTLIYGDRVNQMELYPDTQQVYCAPLFDLIIVFVGAKLDADGQPAELLTEILATTPSGVDQLSRYHRSEIRMQ